MKVVAILAGCVALASAETFYWNKNNDWNTATNWVVGGSICGEGASSPAECPQIGAKIDFKGAPVTITDQSKCTKKGQGAWTASVGHTMRAPVDATLGTLTMPQNAIISFKEGTVMTFKESDSKDTAVEWRCKDDQEIDFKCGDNWSPGSADPAKSLHRVPCSTDTVVFPDDMSAVQVSVPSHTYVSQITVENADGGKPKYALSGVKATGELSQQTNVNTFLDLYKGEVRGTISVDSTCGNQAQCKAYCVNTCPGKAGDSDAAKEEQRIAAEVALKAQQKTALELLYKIVGNPVSDADLEKPTSLDNPKLKAVTDYKNALVTFNDGVKPWVDADGNPVTWKEHPSHASHCANTTAPFVCVKEKINAGMQADLQAYLATLQKGWRHSSGYPKGLDNIVCEFVPVSTGATARTVSKPACSGMDKVEVEQGKSAAFTKDLFTALTTFINAVTYDPITGTTSVDTKVLTPIAKTELKFSYSYSDGDFYNSPYGKSNSFGTSGGFITTKGAISIQNSLDKSKAEATVTAFTNADTATQTKYWEFLAGVIKKTSGLNVKASQFSWGQPAWSYAHGGQTGHSGDPAVFNIVIKNVNGLYEGAFDLAAIKAALGVATYGAANAVIFTPEYYKKQVDAQTTTTTPDTTPAAPTTPYVPGSKVDGDAKVKIIPQKARDEVKAEFTKNPKITAAELTDLAKIAGGEATAAKKTADVAAATAKTAGEATVKAAKKLADATKAQLAAAEATDQAKLVQDAACKGGLSGSSFCTTAKTAYEAAAATLKTATAAVATTKTAADAADKASKDANTAAATTATAFTEAKGKETMFTDLAATVGKKQSAEEIEKAKTAIMDELVSLRAQLAELKKTITDATTSAAAAKEKYDAALVIVKKDCAVASSAACASAEKNADAAKKTWDDAGAAISKAEVEIRPTEDAIAGKETEFDMNSAALASATGKAPAGNGKTLELAKEAQAIAKAAYDTCTATKSAADCATEKDALDTANAAVVAATPTTVASAAAEEGGGGMGMIIGIAAGVVVLIIVGVACFAMSGGGGGNKNGGSSDRNVVAFENPMYDEPGGNSGYSAGDAGDGMYGSPAVDGGGGGADDLYDEPEFGGDAAESGGGAGYLDVAPDDDDDDDDDEDEEASDDEDEEESDDEDEEESDDE